MFDFKYGKLLERAADWEALMKPITDIQSNALIAATEAFDFNHRRILGFALTPAEIAFHAQRDQVCLYYATYKIKGGLKSGLERLRASEIESDKEYEEFL